MDVSRASREKTVVSNDICATCLRASDLIDITKEVHEETTISLLLEKYITLEFHPTPKRICRSCIDEFITINRFIEKCKRSILLSTSFKDRKREDQKISAGNVEEQGFDNKGNGWKKNFAKLKMINTETQEDDKSGRNNALKKIDRNEESGERRKYKNTVKNSNQRKFSLKPLNTNRINKIVDGETESTEKFKSKQATNPNQRLQSLIKPKFIKFDSKKRFPTIEVIETKRQIIEKTQTKTTRDWLIQSVHKKTTTQLKSNNSETYVSEDFRSSSDEEGDVKGRRITSTSTYKSDDVDDFDRLSVARSDFNVDTPRPGYEYRCDHCDCSFMLVSSLAQHRKVHGIAIVSKPYLCEYCGETFMNFSKFRTHRKDHVLEQPYMCLCCEKIVKGPLILNNHLRYHTVELGELSTAGKLDAIENLRTRGKFVCVLCGKLFCSNDILHKHLLWHPDESKLFGCSYCDKTFTQNRSLRNHEYLHKGERKDGGVKGKPNTC